MSNVVQFPGKSALPWPVPTSDMAEAIAMALALCHEWASLNEDVRTGKVRMIGPNVYPVEPRLILSGRDIPISEVVDVTRDYVAVMPLTPIITVLLSFWETDGEDPCRTLGDVAELIENTCDFVLADQQEPPRAFRSPA